MYTIYSKPNCPACESAKSFLGRYGHSFEVVMLDVGQDKVPGQSYITKDELFARIPTAKSVPQIVLGTELIGGMAELQDHILATK